MDSSRRSFIKYSTLAGAAFYFRLSDMAGLLSESGIFQGKIGVSTSIANNNILADAGYNYVEDYVREFLVPGADKASFTENLEKLKDSKLPVEACNTFLPSDLKCVGPGPKHDEILTFATTTFSRASIAGVKIIVLGSGGARRIPEGFSLNEAKDQFMSLCKKLGHIAEKYDVILALEPLNRTECNFINSLEEAGEIVNQVNTRNFRLCADIYHMLMEDESPAPILKYGKLITHVHIAEKNGRCAPGVNNEDFTPYFRALKQIKYNGRITIECKWQDLAEQAAGARSSILQQAGTL
jgi:sugar phosphate isomerase/epimerase